jgi:hypothetical protein
VAGIQQVSASIAYPCNNSGPIRNCFMTEFARFDRRTPGKQTLRDLFG